MFSSSIYQARAKRVWPTARHYNGDGRYVLITAATTNKYRSPTHIEVTVSLLPSLATLAEELKIYEKLSADDCTSGEHSCPYLYDLEEARRMKEAEIESYMTPKAAQLVTA